MRRTSTRAASIPTRSQLAALTADEDEAVSQEQGRLDLLGEAAARLSQAGAQLDHHRQEAGNAGQAPGDADRGCSARRDGSPATTLARSQIAVVRTAT